MSFPPPEPPQEQPTTASNGCVYGSISLVGGSSNMEGTVLLCMNGQWGAICDDFWDINDAKVVCRQLGCQMSRYTITGLVLVSYQCNSLQCLT